MKAPSLLLRHMAAPAVPVLYDADRPVKRRVNVNGHLGEYFDLGCSTAQGCPASPILFLLVAEGLSRLIRDDPDWAPITINKVEHRLSQFADETCLLMRLTRRSIRAMWRCIRLYERATGALANGTKFGGLRFGSLKRDKYNEEFSPGVKPSLGVSPGGKITLSLHVPTGYGIRWCQKGSYIMSLGAPHGWDFSRTEYFESKYYQVKCPHVGLA